MANQSSNEDKHHYEFSLNENQLQILNVAMGLLNKLAPSCLQEVIKETEMAITKSLPGPIQNNFEKFVELQKESSSFSEKAIVDKETMKAILSALRQGRYIECDYFSKARGAIETRELGPAYVELFEGAPYLLAEDPDDENKLKRFKLSRMEKVSVLTRNYKSPGKEICLESLDSMNAMENEENEIFKIEIEGNKKLYEHFREVELHSSQKLTKINEDKCLLQFEMPESYAFFRYMAGFGGWISHIEPKDVMWQIRAIWRKGTENMGLRVERDNSNF